MYLKRGWTHTRHYHKGYLRNVPGQAVAVIAGLHRGRQYDFRLYQLCTRAVADAGTSRPIKVNGKPAGTSKCSANEDSPSLRGRATANAMGHITFEFEQVSGHVALSGIAMLESGALRPAVTQGSLQTMLDACPAGTEPSGTAWSRKQIYDETTGQPGGYENVTHAFQISRHDSGVQFDSKFSLPSPGALACADEDGWPVMKVLSASYGHGGGCHGKENNALEDMARVCDDKETCAYGGKSARAKLGDVHPGCGKAFAYSYMCNGEERTGDQEPEASQKDDFTLACNSHCAARLNSWHLRLEVCRPPSRQSLALLPGLRARAQAMTSHDVYMQYVGLVGNSDTLSCKPCPEGHACDGTKAEECGWHEAYNHSGTLALQTSLDLTSGWSQGPPVRLVEFGVSYADQASTLPPSGSIPRYGELPGLQAGGSTPFTMTWDMKLDTVSGDKTHVATVVGLAPTKSTPGGGKGYNTGFFRGFEWLDSGKNPNCRTLKTWYTYTLTAGLSTLEIECGGAVIHRVPRPDDVPVGGYALYFGRHLGSDAAATAYDRATGQYKNLVAQYNRVPPLWRGMQLKYTFDMTVSHATGALLGALGAPDALVSAGDPRLAVPTTLLPFTEWRESACGEYDEPHSYAVTVQHRGIEVSCDGIDIWSANLASGAASSTFMDMQETTGCEGRGLPCQPGLSSGPRVATLNLGAPSAGRGDHPACNTTGYKNIASGTCTSHGLEYITSAEECKAAAQAVGADVPDGLPGPSGNRQRNCGTWEGALNLHFNELASYKKLCTSCEVSGPENFIGTMTLDECAKRCAEASTCTAFDFGKNGRDGRCFLNTATSVAKISHAYYDAYVVNAIDGHPILNEATATSWQICRDHASDVKWGHNFMQIGRWRFADVRGELRVAYTGDTYWPDKPATTLSRNVEAVVTDSTVKMLHSTKNSEYKTRHLHTPLPENEYGRGDSLKAPNPCCQAPVRAQELERPIDSTAPGIAFGDRFVQIGTWRICALDDGRGSICTTTGETAELADKDSGLIDNAHDLRGSETCCHDREIDNYHPDAPTIGDGYIEIGQWRLGAAADHGGRIVRWLHSTGKVVQQWSGTLASQLEWPACRREKVTIMMPEVSLANALRMAGNPLGLADLDINSPIAKEILGSHHGTVSTIANTVGSGIMSAAKAFASLFRRRRLLEEFEFGTYETYSSDNGCGTSGDAVEPIGSPWTSSSVCRAFRGRARAGALRDARDGLTPGTSANQAESTELLAVELAQAAGSVTNLKVFTPANVDLGSGQCMACPVGYTCQGAAAQKLFRLPADPVTPKRTRRQSDAELFASAGVERRAECDAIASPCGALWPGDNCDGAINLGTIIRTRRRLRETADRGGNWPDTLIETMTPVRRLAEASSQSKCWIVRPTFAAWSSSGTRDYNLRAARAGPASAAGSCSDNEQYWTTRNVARGWSNGLVWGRSAGLAWAAACLKGGAGAYLQQDLGRVRNVSAIETGVRGGGSKERVTAYSVSYSVNGVHYHNVSCVAGDSTLEGWCKGNSATDGEEAAPHPPGPPWAWPSRMTGVVKRFLNTTVQARFVRLTVRSFNEKPSLRMGVMACGATVPDGEGETWEGSNHVWKGSNAASCMAQVKRQCNAFGVNPQKPPSAGTTYAPMCYDGKYAQASEAWWACFYYVMGGDCHKVDHESVGLLQELRQCGMTDGTMEDYARADRDLNYQPQINWHQMAGGREDNGACHGKDGGIRTMIDTGKAAMAKAGKHIVSLVACGPAAFDPIGLAMDVHELETTNGMGHGRRLGESITADAPAWLSTVRNVGKTSGKGETLHGVELYASLTNRKLNSKRVKKIMGAACEAGIKEALEDNPCDIGWEREAGKGACAKRLFRASNGAKIACTVLADWALLSYEARRTSFDQEDIDLLEAADDAKKKADGTSARAKDKAAAAKRAKATADESWRKAKGVQARASQDKANADRARVAAAEAEADATRQARQAQDAADTARTDADAALRAKADAKDAQSRASQASTDAEKARVEASGALTDKTERYQLAMNDVNTAVLAHHSAKLAEDAAAGTATAGAARTARIAAANQLELERGLLNQADRDLNVASEADKKARETAARATSDANARAAEAADAAVKANEAEARANKADQVRTDADDKLATAQRAKTAADKAQATASQAKRSADSGASAAASRKRSASRTAYWAGIEVEDALSVQQAAETERSNLQTQREASGQLEKANQDKEAALLAKEKAIIELEGADNPAAKADARSKLTKAITQVEVTTSAATAATKNARRKLPAWKQTHAAFTAVAGEATGAAKGLVAGIVAEEILGELGLGDLGKGCDGIDLSDSNCWAAAGGWAMNEILAQVNADIMARVSTALKPAAKAATSGITKGVVSAWKAGKLGLTGGSAGRGQLLAAMSTRLANAMNTVRSVSLSKAKNFATKKLALAAVRAKRVAGGVAKKGLSAAAKLPGKLRPGANAAAAVCGAVAGAVGEAAGEAFGEWLANEYGVCCRHQRGHYGLASCNTHKCLDGGTCGSSKRTECEDD
jgi:hypothetical protein